MASVAQISANRANAAHSSGLRTPEGKARCAANAIRHELTAATLVVRDDEHDAFEALDVAVKMMEYDTRRNLARLTAAPATRPAPEKTAPSTPQPISNPALRL